MDIICVGDVHHPQSEHARGRKSGPQGSLVLILGTFKRASLYLVCMGITGALSALLGDGLICLQFRTGITYEVELNSFSSAESQICYISSETL